MCSKVTSIVTLWSLYMCETPSRSPYMCCEGIYRGKPRDQAICDGFWVPKIVRSWFLWSPYMCGQPVLPL